MDPEDAQFHNAEPMTYEQAMAEIDKMPQPEPENDIDRSYQAALAQIDRLAAGEQDPAGMTFGDVAVPENPGDPHVDEPAQHADDPAVAAADSSAGYFDDLNIPAGDPSDHLDLQTGAAPGQPTEAAEQPPGDVADHLDLQTESAAAPGQPAEASDHAHGEPAASTDGDAAAAAVANPPDASGADPATPFDDLNTPAAVVADESSPTNDNGAAAHAASMTGPVDEQAVQPADESPVAHATVGDAPVGPGIGEAVVDHAIGEAPSAAGADVSAVAAAAAQPFSEPAAGEFAQPAAEHPASGTPATAPADDPKAEAGALHAGEPASAHLTDEPITGADAGTLESTQPAEPAVVDVDVYEAHLHELNSDQLLDEAFHQGQPELQQAALEELRHRLHGDEAPSTGEHEPVADPIVVTAEETPHEPAAEPLPEEPPPAVEAPEPLSAQALETMLDDRAGATDESLEWKSSVVDLLKLCGMDSSHEARERYAVELGFPAGELGETSSAELNTWLHGQLLTTLEQNGGNLPAGLA